MFLKWNSLYCQMQRKLELSKYQQPEPAVYKVSGIYGKPRLTQT